MCKWVWKFYSIVSLQANRDETQTVDPSAARADVQALIAAGKSTLLYLGIECYVRWHTMSADMYMFKSILQNMYHHIHLHKFPFILLDFLWYEILGM